MHLETLFLDPVDGLQKSSLLGKADMFKVMISVVQFDSRAEAISLLIEVIITSETSCLRRTVKQAQTHTLNFSNRGRWVGIFPGRPTTQHSASRFCPAAVESRTQKHVNRKKGREDARLTRVPVAGRRLQGRLHQASHFGFQPAPWNIRVVSREPSISVHGRAGESAFFFPALRGSVRILGCGFCLATSWNFLRPWIPRPAPIRLVETLNFDNRRWGSGG